MTASDRSDLNNRKLTYSLAGFWLSKTGQHAGSDLRHLQRYVGMGFTEAQLMTAILKAAEQDTPSLASLSDILIRYGAQRRSCDQDRRLAGNKHDATTHSRWAAMDREQRSAWWDWASQCENTYVQRLLAYDYVQDLDHARGPSNKQMEMVDTICQEHDLAPHFLPRFRSAEEDAAWARRGFY